MRSLKGYNRSKIVDKNMLLFGKINLSELFVSSLVISEKYDALIVFLFK